jgi:hypothetical protein
MLIRTLLFGFGGIFVGGITFVLATWLEGDASLKGIYLPCAAGFIAGVVGNLVCEYFGFYQINLLARLLGRRRG